MYYQNKHVRNRSKDDNEQGVLVIIFEATFFLVSRQNIIRILEPN